MSTSPQDPFDRSAQRTAKRRAVIRAAGQAFARKGYHSTSMTEIANSLGLTKTALYYYVKSKDEILFECHIMVYDAMDEIVGRRPGRGTSGLDHLTRIFSDLVSLLTAEGLPLLTEIDALAEDNRAEILTRRGRIEQRITDIVETGMQDGTIAAGDARLAVYFFMGALNWLNVWYRPEGRLSAEEISRQFTRQLRGGLSAAPSP